MARTALTTAWSTLGTTVTGTYAQNHGDGPILVASAAAEPVALAEVGYLLQAGDFVQISGLASTNIYARSFDATGAVEADTLA